MAGWYRHAAPRARARPSGCEPAGSTASKCGSDSRADTKSSRACVARPGRGRVFTIMPSRGPAARRAVPPRWAARTPPRVALSPALRSSPCRLITIPEIRGPAFLHIQMGQFASQGIKRFILSLSTRQAASRSRRHTHEVTCVDRFTDIGVPQYYFPVLRALQSMHGSSSAYAHSARLSRLYGEYFFEELYDDVGARL